MKQICLVLALVALNPMHAAAANPKSPPVFTMDWSHYPLAHLDLPPTFHHNLLATGSRTLAEALLATEQDLTQLDPGNPEGLDQFKAFLARRRIAWPVSDFAAVPWAGRVQLYRLGLRSKADLLGDPERLPDLLEDLRALNPLLARALDHSIQFWSCERDFEAKP